jgi:hypothetical protein
MNNGNTIERRTTRGGLLVAGVAALGLAFAAAAQANYGDGINPPRVPDKLEVPAGNRAFLVGHALGTQNYVCLPSATGGVAWSLFTPQATLFDDAGTQAGPTGGNTLTRTTFIQRVNTVGGSAPSTGCAVSTDVGSKAFVPTGRITFSTRTPRGRDNPRGFVRQGPVRVGEA